MAKRGRPPLSDEEKAERLKNKPNYHKVNAYASQKRYKAKIKGTIYEPKVRIPIECHQIILDLSNEKGVSISRLFVAAFEEKYGVILHKTDDTE